MHEPIDKVLITKSGIVVSHSKQATFVRIDNFFIDEESTLQFLPLTSSWISRLGEKDFAHDLLRNYIQQTVGGENQIIKQIHLQKVPKDQK